MLIVGDLSGIQEFIFALAEEEDGLARMLRARPFYVQALSEVLAWRVQRTLDKPRDTLLFCAAGKFAILVENAAPDTPARLRAMARHQTGKPARGRGAAVDRYDVL